MTSDSINDMAMANLTVKYSVGGGAVTSFIGWLSSSETVILVGTVATIVGFLLNVIFLVIKDRRHAKQVAQEMELMKKEDARKQALFEEQMKQLKGKSNG